MKITIDNKEDSPLLSRTKIAGEMVYEGPTPSRSQVAEAISRQVSADKSLVVVHRIDTSFGFGTAKISAVVYKDAESLKKLEDEYMVKRHQREAPKEESGKEAVAENEKSEAEKPAEDSEGKDSAEDKKEEEEKPSEDSKKE